MKSKYLYAGGTVFLLAVVLGLGNLDTPQHRRVEQHLTYNTEVADTSLSIDARTFTSRLPIVAIDTGGSVIPGKPEPGQPVRDIPNTYTQADMRIYDKNGTLNALDQEPAIDSRIQIRVRGNSSRTFDKTGYLFKFINKHEQEKSYPVMGMEKDSTWVLHGPYLDKTLMRNYMWYNLSGQIMEWAPDVRYCEVFLDGTYQGVYVMTEQVSVAEGRVEVKKYRSGAPVTSYIVCVDRVSVNDVDYLDNFTNYTERLQSRIEVKYPGAKNLRPELTDYISTDFSRFEKSLYSFDYDSRRYGYWSFIDVDNFVDYFLINEITQNTDAGLYSTYFYKDVAGKLKLAVWDFNNCCDNNMADQLPMAGFFMQTRPWFFMLTKDESFVNKTIERYRYLRKGILSDDSVNAYITSVQEYLGPAIERNFQVWGYSFEPEYDLLTQDFRKIGSYEEAVEQYRQRLISHMNWMDDHIEDLKFYSHESKNKKFNH